MNDKAGAEHALFQLDRELWATYTFIRHTKNGRFAVAARRIWKDLPAEDRATLEGVAKGIIPGTQSNQ